MLPCSPQGGVADLLPASAFIVVKKAIGRAGLAVMVSTHGLRHAHVSHALDRGAPVHFV